MSLARIPEGIVTAWDAASGDDTFTGGIHFGSADPDDTDVPYVVMISLGVGRAGGNSSTEIRTQGIQLSCFYLSDDTNDPITTGSSYLDSLESIAKSATIPSGTGRAMKCEVTRRHIEEDMHHKELYQAQLDVEYRLSIDGGPGLG